MQSRRMTLVEQSSGKRGGLVEQRSDLTERVGRVPRRNHLQWRRTAAFMLHRARVADGCNATAALSNCHTDSSFTPSVSVLSSVSERKCCSCSISL